MNPSTTAIGIDLGTTFSCVAIVTGDKNEPKVISNNFGKNVTPSVVAYEVKNNSILTGDTAVTANVPPTNLIYDSKRMIGRQYNDTSVQNDMKLWPSQVVDQEGKPHVKLTHENTEILISPEEISSEILKEMKATAERFMNGEVTGAVITVPAYFNHRQRAETMKAAELAGIKVLRLINEPTAAAIAYGQKDNLDGKSVLVFDLGGGTLDVSIVKGEQRTLKVVAIAGHNHLGGQDFDQLIMQYVIDTYKNETGRDFPTTNPKLTKRLRLASLEAKKTLSHSERPVQINVENVREGENFDCELSRSQFNKLVEPKLRGSLDVVDTALKQANMKERNIDYVLLIGGSTRIPLMMSLLAEKFGQDKLRHRINPDEAVALGAAILAYDLERYPPNIGDNYRPAQEQPKGDERHKYTCDIHDIIPLSIGISVRGGQFLKVIDRFTEYPCRKESSLSTAYDNQGSSYSGVYEGERANVESSNMFKFGSVTLDLQNKKERRGYPLKVIFDIDINGLLNITKVETKTGKTASLDIQYNGNAHTEDDIEAIVAEARRYEKEDEKFLELIDKRKQFENIIYSVKRNFEEQTGEQNNRKLQVVAQYLEWSDALPPEITAYDVMLDQFFEDIEKC